MARNFPHSYIVCNCKQVSLGEVIYAIKEKGAKTLDNLEDLTDAGSSYGHPKRNSKYMKQLKPESSRVKLDYELKK